MSITLLEIIGGPALHQLVEGGVGIRRILRNLTAELNRIFGSAVNDPYRDERLAVAAAH